MKTKLIASLAALLIVFELVLVLLSWVLSATTTWMVHSLLSSEGIRWFLGHANEMILSPVLVWILLFSIAYGIFVGSGFHLHSENRRERTGRHIAIVVLLFYIFIVVLLIAFPHAILLSSTGNIYPSPFSKAFVPMLAFGWLLLGVSYGLSTRSFKGFTSIVEAAVNGLKKVSPLLLLYVLFIQFYESLCYVFF